MVLKKSYSALEKLSEDLLKAMDEFNRRNSLAVVLQSRDKIHVCCERCLKAFAMKRANENEKKLIEKVLRCEAGHYCYYLDRGEIIKSFEKPSKSSKLFKKDSKNRFFDTFNFGKLKFLKRRGYSKSSIKC